MKGLELGHLLNPLNNEESTDGIATIREIMTTSTFAAKLRIAIVSYFAGVVSLVVAVLVLIYAPTSPSVPTAKSPAPTPALISLQEASQNVLVLPAASTNFASRWHGIEKLVRETDPADPAAKEQEGGAYFKVQNVQVSATAEVWGTENLKLISSSGRVEDPTHVKLMFELLLEQPNSDGIWLINEADLTLTKGRTMESIETLKYMKTAVRTRTK